MDDFNTVYALLVLVMLFILLSRLDNRFGKIEKELNEIKKRMEDYLKVQQNSVAEASKPKEEISEKETKDIPVMPSSGRACYGSKDRTTRRGCSGKTRTGC